MFGLDIGAIVAGAGGGQEEGLDGEGEVLVIGVIHQEPGQGGKINIGGSTRGNGT